MRTQHLIFVALIILISVTAFLYLRKPQVKTNSSVIESQYKALLSPTLQPTASTQQAKGLTIRQGEAQVVPGTDITIGVEKITLPGSSCRDCISSATIVASSKNGKKTHEFKSGGFAGNLPSTLMFEGYRFTMEDLTPTGLQLSYTKE